MFIDLELSTSNQINQTRQRNFAGVSLRMPLSIRQASRLMTQLLFLSGTVLAISQTNPSLKIDPDYAFGGAKLSAQISLRIPAPAGGYRFALSGDRTVAHFPDYLDIPAGAKTSSFNIITSPVEHQTRFEVRASGNKVDIHAGFILMPIPMKSLKATESIFGGRSGKGSVTIAAPAPIGGLRIGLDSDNPRVLVPRKVLIHQGQLSTSFVIHTKPGAVEANTLITASLNSKHLKAQVCLKCSDLNFLLDTLDLFTLDSETLNKYRITSKEDLVKYVDHSSMESLDKLGILNRYRCWLHGISSTDDLHMYIFESARMVHENLPSVPRPPSPIEYKGQRETGDVTFTPNGNGGFKMGKETEPVFGRKDPEQYKAERQAYQKQLNSYLDAVEIADYLKQTEADLVDSFAELDGLIMEVYEKGKNKVPAREINGMVNKTRHLISHLPFPYMAGWGNSLDDRLLLLENAGDSSALGGRAATK
jgi:hypothetical protein